MSRPARLVGTTEPESPAEAGPVAPRRKLAAMTKTSSKGEILKAVLLEATTVAPAAPSYRNLARAAADRLQELGLPIDGLTAPAPRKRRAVPLERRIALAEEKRNEAWAALKPGRSSPASTSCTIGCQRPASAPQPPAAT